MIEKLSPLAALDAVRVELEAGRLDPDCLMIVWSSSDAEGNVHMAYRSSGDSDTRKTLGMMEMLKATLMRDCLT